MLNPSIFFCLVGRRYLFSLILSLHSAGNYRKSRIKRIYYTLDRLKSLPKAKTLVKAIIES